MIRRCVVWLSAVAALTAIDATAQPPAAPAKPETPRTTWYARNWTRVSYWDFFKPPPGGGDPTNADIANRLQFGVERSTGKYDITAALQYVQFGGLPRDAVGPGPLGLGAVYFDHAGRSNSRQLYLRYLNVRLKALAPGLTVQVGRMGYTSGAEAISGVPKIEAVKRQRVDSRLIGEFEWSIYQRGFDGIRADWRRGGWQLTGAAFRPTQGGFEDAAGLTIDDIDLLTASLTARPGAILPRTEWQLFANRYDDRRAVRARPDNTGRSAAAVDVQVNSIGATLVGAYPAGRQQMDALLWIVGQTGSWYEQSHRASAIAAEAGVEWPASSWRPWIRGGWLRASGDREPGDTRHGTFFQVLPTVRRFSQSATYSLMNLTDAFAQIFIRPTPRLTMRVDYHRVGLAEAADRWYSGSGATQESGTVFGYAGRPSQGARTLGDVVEASADWAIKPRWSVNAYAGSIWGGEVVRRTFAGTRLTFLYVENVIRF